MGTSALRRTIPNSLSLARMVLALIFPLVLPAWRAPLIVAAALSDLFDGMLSRAFQGTSILGQILDPIADKLFVGIVLITLLVHGELTVAELLLIGFRDLAVIVGSAWTVARRGFRLLRQLPPSILGKFATAGQFAFLLSRTLGIDRNYSVEQAFELVVGIVSILAGIDYLRRKPSETGEYETSQL